MEAAENQIETQHSIFSLQGIEFPPKSPEWEEAIQELAEARATVDRLSQDSQSATDRVMDLQNQVTHLTTSNRELIRELAITLEPEAKKRLQISLAENGAELQAARDSADASFLMGKQQSSLADEIQAEIRPLLTQVQNQEKLYYRSVLDSAYNTLVDDMLEKATLLGALQSLKGGRPSPVEWWDTPHVKGRNPHHNFESTVALANKIKRELE